jgi:hypothetical protein
MKTPMQSGGEALPEIRDLNDAVSLLIKGIQLNELIYTAGAGFYHESVREKGEAIMAGADILKDILDDVKDVLYAVMERKAGEA